MGTSHFLAIFLRDVRFFLGVEDEGFWVVCFLGFAETDLGDCFTMEIYKEGRQICLPFLYHNLRFNYLACSNCKVLVGSSHTSVGPKYWIGPGYTYAVSLAQASRLAANFL